MANPDFLAAVKAGSAAVNNFRAQNSTLDLSDADLAGLNLDDMNLSGANLRGADLSRCQATGVDLSRADLSNTKIMDGRFNRANLGNANLSNCEISSALLESANLENANLSRSTWARTNLQSANFAGANVDGTSFALANLQHAKITHEQLIQTDIKGATLRNLDLTGINLNDRDLTRTDFGDCRLDGANLSHSNIESGGFSNASLERANLVGVNAKSAIFVQARLQGANLSGAKLAGSSFQMAKLDRAKVSGADFYEADLSRASLGHVTGAYRARHLQTTRIPQNEDVFYFQTVARSWPERWLDWEKIRIAGRLPLLGVSYTGLITIPIFVYALGIYNENVEFLKTWLVHTLNNSTGAEAVAASTVIQHLHTRPIPSRFLILFLATLLLAAASTIYAFACPSRIKSFSRDQWCDELRNSLVHYWPEAWKRRRLRIACALFYTLGGIGALYALSDKLWRVGVILYYSSPLV